MASRVETGVPTTQVLAPDSQPDQVDTETQTVPPRVDLEEARRFLHALDPAAELFHFRTFDDRGRGAGRNYHGGFDECATNLQLDNGNGRGVFVVINEGGQKASEITRVRAVFADFDNAGSTQVDGPVPHLAIESSPGRYHFYWRVEGMALDAYKPVQQAIAKLCGSDPSVCDLPRVMRLPGFVHHKGHPFRTRIVRESVDAPYPAEWIQTAFSLGPHAPPAPRSSPATATSSGVVVDFGRHEDMLKLAGQLARKVHFDGLGTAAALAALNTEASRGRWTRVIPEDELRRAFEGALAKCRSGEWNAPEQADGPAREASTSPLRVPLDDLLTAEIPPPRCVISPIIPRRAPTLLAGHGEAGKTNLALTLLAHAACGLPWAGYACDRPMRGVLFSFEDHGDLIRWRLRAIADVYGLDVRMIADKLNVYDASDTDAALVAEQPGGKTMRETPMFRRVASMVEGADLIVVDNASDAFDGDENNRRQVRYFMRLLRRLAQTNDAGLVLLAHVNKDAAQYGDGGKHGQRGEGYSGSTAWHNSARSRLYLEASRDVGDGKPRTVTLRHQKNNYGPKAGDACFKWVTAPNGAGVQVPLLSAEHGEPQDASALLTQDADTILAVVGAAREGGIVVPAAMGGAATAMHALADLPELPRHYTRGRSGRERLRMALVQLQRDGRLEAVEVKTSSRNTRLILELTPTGINDLARVRSSFPHTPSATDARAGKARASSDSGEITTTDETHATHAGANVTMIFTPYGGALVSSDSPATT